jgi:hypothetical protein
MFFAEGIFINCSFRTDGKMPAEKIITTAAARKEMSRIKNRCRAVIGVDHKRIHKKFDFY